MAEWGERGNLEVKRGESRRHGAKASELGGPGSARQAEGDFERAALHQIQQGTFHCCVCHRKQHQRHTRSHGHMLHTQPAQNSFEHFIK